MARFANPYTPRTEIGAGLQNIMTALFASKANTSGLAGAAAHRTPSQDVKDQADALKSTAEAAQINRVESGVNDFVPNFAKSLVPENEVPNVMERNKTGIWPAFEDPRRQQSVTEGVGPVDWTPEKDLALNDAKRNSAYLNATKEANFKDLAASMEGAASDRELTATLGRFLPPAAAPAPAPAGPQAPQFGLPSGPGMAMPTQVDDGNGVITKPMAAGPAVTATPLAVDAPPPAISAPTVAVSGKAGINTEALLNAAAAVAGKHHEVSTALTGVANAARGQQEADFRSRERNDLKPVPGVEGTFYDKDGNVYDANKSRILTGDQVRALGVTQKQAGATKIDIANNSFDKTGGAERAKQAQSMQSNAIKASEFSGTVQALAAALDGYGGGPMTEFQGKIGHYLPESEYGKIASVQNVVDSLRTKLATTVRASGSGATSDFEMKSYLASIPGLINTPNGRKMMAEVAERMAEREAVASDIYQSLAEKGPVKIAEWRKAVRAQVGDLLTPEEIRQMREGMTAPAPAPVGSTAAQPSRQELEAEARKRGLLK